MYNENIINKNKYMKPKSLLTGLLAGAAIGLFFAPKEGSKTRKAIKKDIKAGNLGFSVLKGLFVDMGKEMGDCYTECVPEETAVKIKETADSAKDLFNEKKEILKNKANGLKESLLDKEEEFEEKAKKTIKKAEKQMNKTVKIMRKTAKSKIKEFKK